MPTLSMFHGIIIRMYYAPREHPPPHFHVYYGGYKGVINIRDGRLERGTLPRRQLRLVVAWTELYRDELLADWDLVMTGQEPFKIMPLR